MTAAPHPWPDKDRLGTPRAAEQASGAPTLPATQAAQVGYAEVAWHLGEVTAALRREASPLGPELLRVVLRGVGELCGLLHQRGPEPAVQPPSLFRDTPVVAEALGMWEARLRSAITERQRAAGHPGEDRRR